VGSGVRVGLPECGRPGHKGSHVTLNGVYGSPGHVRQRYRCYPPEGRAHTFVGIMAREVVSAGVCEACENHLERHQGPTMPRRYRYPARAQAAALVAVGKGEPYASAARKARLWARQEPTADDDGGQLVANWVEVLGPAILAHYAEVEWPETLLLDSTNFFVPDHQNGGTKQAFAVMAAYGYPAAGGRGRAWAVSVSPTATRQDWRTFLDALPGAPRLFVSDKAGATLAAVKGCWSGADQPVHHRCEWHLRDNVVKLMRPYGLTSYGSPEMELLNDAFHSPAGWSAFKDAMQPYRNVREWIGREDKVVTPQVARRHQIPAHYSVSAVERTISRLKEMLEPRRFCFRNATRTNHLVGLMRLELNGQANERDYAEIIRTHLQTHGGRPGRQLVIKDPRGIYSLRP